MVSVSKGQQVTRERVARQRIRQRRRLVWVQVGAASVLVLSTLAVWMSHPRYVSRGGRVPRYVVREVSRSIGLQTWPAGVVTLALGLLAFVCVSLLKGGRARSGWVALGIGLAALGVSIGEIVQLLLGRRNWLAHLPPAHWNSPLAHATGAGVWLAVAASIMLVVNAWTYLVLAYGQWQDAQAASEKSSLARARPIALSQLGEVEDSRSLLSRRSHRGLTFTPFLNSKVE